MTRLLSHRPQPRPSLAVSWATSSEPRAPPRSLPSSRRRDLHAQVRRRPIVFAFVSAPVDTAHHLTSNPTRSQSSSTTARSRRRSRDRRGPQGQLDAAIAQVSRPPLEPAPECSLLCQRPLTLLSLAPPTSLACSLRAQQIGDEGRLPHSLRSSRRRDLQSSSAPPPRQCSLLCQRPLTQKRAPPCPTCVRKRTRSLSEHIPCLALQNLPALAHKRTHTPPFPIPSSTRCCPPSCAAWTAATSSCRTAGSRVRPPPSQPPATSPSQLGVQQPQRRGQAGRQRRRGQRRR